MTFLLRRLLYVCFIDSSYNIKAFCCLIYFNFFDNKNQLHDTKKGAVAKLQIAVGNSPFFALTLIQ